MTAACGIPATAARCGPTTTRRWATFSSPASRPTPRPQASYFGGSQDNGTATRLLHGETLERRSGAATAATPTPTRTTRPSTSRKTTASGWSVPATAATTSRPWSTRSTIADPAAFYVPYEVMPGRTSEVILGTCRVWMGPASPTTAGAGWAPISADLSTGDSGPTAAPQRQSSSASLRRLRTPRSSTPSPNDGVVQRSTNATSLRPPGPT